jgi:hypothetical protein
MIATKNLVTALAVLLALASSSASPAWGRGPISSVFAVPRGGGLFGGKEKETSVAEADV